MFEPEAIISLTITMTSQSLKYCIKQSLTELNGYTVSVGFENING